MKKILAKILLSFTIIFFWSKATSYAQENSIVINEIAWMGTQDGFTKEWIELYNPSDRNININGWHLIDKLGKIDITLKGEISPFSFFVLERSSDKTLPDIKADIVYSGALKNSGGDLVLINKEGKIIDQVSCKSGWFAGDNKTKRTMERRSTYASGADPNNWQTSIHPGGTPKKKNLILVSKKEVENVSNQERANLENFSLKNSFFSKFLLASISSFSLTFLVSKFKFNREKQNY